MRRISKFLLPSIIGINAYLVIHRLFPDKVNRFNEDPMKDIGGGDTKIRLFTRVLRAIAKNRALKVAIIAAFGSDGGTSFLR